MARSGSPLVRCSQALRTGYIRISIYARDSARKAFQARFGSEACGRLEERGRRLGRQARCSILRRRGCQSFDSASPNSTAQVGGAPPAGQLPVATTSNGSFLNPMSPFAARVAPGSAARLVDDHDCQSQDTFLESSLQC